MKGSAREPVRGLVGAFGALARRGSKWASGHVPLRTVRIKPDRPVLSITFDDVISSAAHQGAAILVEAGVRGTFYVAGGLTDSTEEGHHTHQVSDLLALAESGHQLACHGWSHRPLSTLSAAEIKAELERNAEFVRDVCAQAGASGSGAAGWGALGPLDLAYPLGDHSWQTKRIASGMRGSLRVTGGGLHQGRTDLGALGSYRLYGAGADRQAWERFLADLVNGGGWGIVNTHAVASDPGPYGVEPATLRAFVARAQQLGIEIVPVGAALERFRGAQR